MRMNAPLAVVLLLLSTSIADSMVVGGFDDFAADTTSRVAIVEVACLRAEGDLHPPQFRALRVIRGAAPDTFTAGSTYWRPLSPPDFRVGETYLLGLRTPGPLPRYEVVERFSAVAPPQWHFRAIERLADPYLERLGGRDSVITRAAKAWDMKGPRQAAMPSPPWSQAQRDTFIAHLTAAIRAGKPSRERRLSNGMLVESVELRDPAGAPTQWLEIASALEQHPDSAVRRLAFALWDTTRVSSIRDLALFLIIRDTSAEAREWLVHLPTTGVLRLDQDLAQQLVTLRDTTAEARSMARRLLLVSHPGDVIEKYAFIVLRHDTSDDVRAERWRRVAACETRPYTWGWIEKSPERWDNWAAALGWTRAEAWRAFDDTSSRLRVVATRVLCVRGDSDAVAEAMRRVRTRRGPLGQELTSDELVSIAEVLPDSKRLEALRFAGRLALQHDALGSAALHAITYVDTPEIRRVLRLRLQQNGGRDSSYEAESAARALARWAHREDLPTFHRLAVDGGEQLAREALHAIGRLEGPKTMAFWIERRYRGSPPRKKWSRYVMLEEEVRLERR